MVLGMGIIERLGRAMLAWDARDEQQASTSAGIMPPSRLPAQPPMDPQRALSISTVYRAFQVLATSVMQISLDIERGDEVLPLPSFMSKPDVDLPAEAFPELTVTSLAATGNAFWRIDRLPGGSTPLSISVLNPQEVFIHADPSDPLKLVNYSWRGQVLHPHEVRHLSLMRLPWRIRGLGPIEAARAELAGAASMREYSSQWFDVSDVPSGVLSTDQQINTEQAALMKSLWRETADGGVRVLGQGMRYSPIMLNPKDAQWLEARRFSTTEISRLFGMPASIMLATVEGNSSTYANVEQDWIGYVRFTLMRYLKEIEAAWTTLLPRGHRARHNVDALLRTDTKTRYETHRTGLEAGFLTVNEVRRMEHLPPVAGGEALKKPTPQPAQQEIPA